MIVCVGGVFLRVPMDKLRAHIREERHAKQTPANVLLYAAASWLNFKFAKYVAKLVWWLIAKLLFLIKGSVLGVAMLPVDATKNALGIGWLNWVGVVVVTLCLRSSWPTLGPHVRLALLAFATVLKATLCQSCKLACLFRLFELCVIFTLLSCSAPQRCQCTGRKRVCVLL